MTLWVRFAYGHEEGFGTLEGDTIALHEGDMFSNPKPTGRRLPGAEVQLLAPVRPRSFVGLWNNFHAAAAKQGNPPPDFPLYFLKNSHAVIGPGEPIRPPGGYQGKVIYEGELGLVIGRRVQAAGEAESAAAIFGLTCVNDVTALDLLTTESGFPQWARAKGCDSFGPIGPAIATGLDWQQLSVQVALNGRVRQDYPLSDMIIPPARIVELISQEMTLHPGDVIACGTSIGALPMRPGMEVAVSIAGIGTLTNPYAP